MGICRRRDDQSHDSRTETCRTVVCGDHFREGAKSLYSVNSTDLCVLSFLGAHCHCVLWKLAQVYCRSVSILRSLIVPALTQLRRLSFRTMINVYMQLGKFVDTMDAEAVTRGEGPEDKAIDKDFRSGVELGVGASNMILSLMPEKVLSVVELFGYKGDRKVGLTLLAKAGGWTKDSTEPGVGVGRWMSGRREPVTDICL